MSHGINNCPHTNINIGVKKDKSQLVLYHPLMDMLAMRKFYQIYQAYPTALLFRTKILLPL